MRLTPIEAAPSPCRRADDDVLEGRLVGIGLDWPDRGGSRGCEEETTRPCLSTCRTEVGMLLSDTRCAHVEHRAPSRKRALMMLMHTDDDKGAIA